MKKTTFTLLLTLSCCWLAAQCPTGDITFSSQGHIDSFPINFPGCIAFPGTVIISGLDITNLQGLSGLDSINGCCWIINNPQLVSLGGLENLSHVGECEKYVGINQLGRRGLQIEGNALLTSIFELHNLKSVKSCISIVNNSSLTALNGLNSLFSVGGCGTYLSGAGWFPTHSIGIIDNESLKTIDGLSSLESLGLLYISGNDSLVSLNGLENIRTVGGLYVGYNASLPNFKGLDNLQFAGRLDVEFNDGLQNFEGLENLDTIYCQLYSIQEGRKSLRVEGNFSLIDFSGLDNVQTIGCGGGSIVNIIGNWSLQSLSGIGGNIDSLIELTIQGNPNLSICETPPICAYLENGGPAPVTISDNAPGCNSVGEIEAACMVSIDETPGGKRVFHISPNPATDFLHIQIDDSEKWDICLYDLQGRLLYRQLVSGSQTIDVGDWPAGLYVLRAVSGERAYAGQFVKQ